MSFLSRFFGSSAPSVSTESEDQAMADAKIKAQAIIEENAVAIFSKSWCPYCGAAKQLLQDSGANFKVVELDLEKDGGEIQEALQELTGQHTVPNIFIGKKHIGGNSDLQAKRKQLKDLLSNAGAL